MDGFTIIDGVIAGVILISAFLAWSRGFVREVLAIGGWILAAIVAFIFAPQAEPLVKEIPVAGDFLGDSCELSMLAAFTLVFVVALIVVSIFTPLFSSMVHSSALAGFDQGLGFLFGILRGVVLVAVAFVVYDRIVPQGQGVEIVDQSRSAMLFEQSRGAIEKQIPADAPEWLTRYYQQLTSACQKEGGSSALERPRIPGRAA